MLVRPAGLITALDGRSHRHPFDSASAVGGVRAKRLVEGDDQQTVLLKLRIRQQRGDVTLQPVVGGAHGAVVCVVTQVRRYKRETGQRPVDRKSTRLNSSHVRI